MSDNRDVGVEFGDLQDDLEGETYPLSADELLARYGDRRVEHAGGSASLGELLGEGPQGRYGSADEVHQAVLTMVGEGAEGREGYTDRGTGATGEEYDQESF